MAIKPIAEPTFTLGEPGVTLMLVKTALQVRVMPGLVIPFSDALIVATPPAMQLKA